MKSVLCKFAATAAVFALVIASADAQRPGGGRPGGGGFGFGGGGFGGGGFGGFGGGGEAVLLANAAVQEELKLSDEIKGKLKEQQDKMMAKVGEIMQGLRDTPREQMREKMMEAMKPLQEEGAKFIEENLSAEQRKRLKQISTQLALQAGPMAYTSKDIAEGIKLTDSQKTKLEALAKEYREDMAELFRSGMGGGNREEMQKKMEAIRKDAQEKADEIITADQKKILEEMQGAKFDLAKLRQGFPMGGRRPMPRKDD